MKIEKINDKQIRCTISKSDLTERKIKLSELACGTGNSKELFRDMIRQASDDFGFEVDDIPLMVEAIPVSSECIILILTKVDDPAETESHFAKLLGEEEMKLLEKFNPDEGNPFEIIDETLDMEELDDEDFDHYDDATVSHSSKVSKSFGESDSKLLFSIYSFESLTDVIKVSKLIHSIYDGDSALYKSPLNDRYYLSLCTDSAHKKSLNYVTGILSEYGTHEYAVYNSEFYFMEHFDCIVDKDALEKLSEI